MTERMWGHDAIRIEVPYAIAKIIADRDHPHRDEVTTHISIAIGNLISHSSLIEQSPIAIVIDGIILDGEDLSMGPVAYVRKVFMDDVEYSHAMLKQELENM